MSLASAAMTTLPLLQATAEFPWSVEAVSALPASVQEPLAEANVNNAMATSTGPWHASCWLVPSNDNTAAMIPTIHVWYATGTLKDQKLNATLVWKLQHPDHVTIHATTKDANSPTSSGSHVFLALASPTPDTVFCYALHAHTQRLVVWKVHHQSASLFSGTNHHDSIKPLVSLIVDETEPHAYVTSLHVDWTESSRSPILLVGTSRGTVYWITQTKVPVALRVLKVEDSNASSTGTSIMGRLFGSSSSSTASPPVPDDTADRAILACHAVSPTAFMVVSRKGRVQWWHATRTESHIWFARGAATTLTPPCEPDDGPPTTWWQQNTTGGSVLSTAVSATVLHAMVLVQCHDASSHSTTLHRLYWMILSIDDTAAPPTVMSSTWLDQFATPETVDVLGMCAVHDGHRAYALVSATNGTGDTAPVLTGLAVRHVHPTPVTLWTMDFAPSILHSILRGSMVPDVLTHGVTVLDAQGFGVRLRVEADVESTVPPLASLGTPTTAKTLALSQQLQSAFGRFYEHSVAIRLPPSLTVNATLDELEAAALHAAHQLASSQTSHRGNSTVWPMLTANPMDAHHAYIQLLRQGGVYRNMSLATKWKLLALGQSVCVFMTLQQLAASSNVRLSAWQRDLWADFDYANLSAWLARAQGQCLTPDKATVWTMWLVQAMQAAMMFREEHAKSCYDVSPDQVPTVSAPDLVPTWTSALVIRQVLLNQLEYWLDHSSGVSVEDVQDIVQKALVSCADSFRSCPGPDTRAAYVRTQQESFRLVRSIQGRVGDEFLFELAVAHGYFQGVCQISKEHQSRRDAAKFAISPLCATLATERDVETDMLFGRYVLTWHLDRKLYGYLLDYGKHWPDDLQFFLNHHESLAPYRWIHAVRQGDFETAADALVSTATTGKITLGDAQSALCMASLTNTVVERNKASLHTEAAQRRCLIEKKRELIIAQYALFGSAVSEDTMLAKPDQLINSAIQKSEQATDLDDKVYFLEIALGSSFTEEDDDKMRSGALLVWIRAILADRSRWEHWLSSRATLTDAALVNVVLDETVFGLLHQQCAKNPEWGPLSFGAVSETMFGASELVSSLDPLLEHKGLQRLLTAATKNSHGSHAPTEAMLIED